MFLRHLAFKYRWRCWSSYWMV